MVEVTQADRDAAAAFFRDERTDLAVKFRLGHDPKPLLETLARHRIEAERRGIERAAEVVRESITPPFSADAIADAIRALPVGEG